MVNSTDLIYAQKLKSLRLKKNLKQFAVYERLGFNNKQACSKLENGKMEFTDELIQKISEIFGIGPDHFADPSNSIQLHNSSHVNNNSPQGIVNDISLIRNTIEAKDETISTLKQCLKIMEE